MESPAAPTPVTDLVTPRRILALYAPLAASWLMMSVESPISIAIISRMEDATVNAAAFLMMMALAIFIESPVIDLLSTSTTLARGKRSLQAITRYSVALIVWVTVAHALFVFTPVYGWVTVDLLRLDPRVVEAMWPGLAIMIPWSGFIGWRRYLQGALIRAGHTRAIGTGTFLRVSTIAIVGFGLYALSPLNGIVIVAIALVASVGIEAVFIHAVSRPILGSIAAQPEDGEPVTVRRLMRFHLPLTVSTMVMLTATPMIGAALARTADAVTAQAAWQIAITLLFPLRTITFALPEVVIALYRGHESARVLRAFCVRVGLVCTAVLLALVLTTGDRAFFAFVLDAPRNLIPAASIAVVGCVALPLLGALAAYVRGLLTAHHMTFARLWAIGASVSALALALWVGVALAWPGVVVAAVALTASQLAEYLALQWAWHRRPQGVGGCPAPVSSRTVRALPVLFLTLAAGAASADSLQLGLYADRAPTPAEVARNDTGAKHEPAWGCYLGAYIDLDSTLTETFTDQTGRVRRNPEPFETRVAKRHATYFFYLGYGTRVPEDWLSRLALDGKIVHIAFEPNRGLEFVRDDAYLREVADTIRRSGAKVFLRFASEMNGPWVGYHGNPELYREKFRLVARVMRERAPNVAMVWCPYATPTGPIPSYYPGDDAVDWVGVNLYSVTYYNQDRRTPGSTVHPTSKLDYIYRRYAARKPIMIAEFGATHFSALEGRSQTPFAQRSIFGLYESLPRRYPRVKAINYFNANNLELTHRLNNNYAVTQNPDVLSLYRLVVSEPYFLSDVPSDVPRLAPSRDAGLYPVNGPSTPPVTPMPVREGQTLSGTVRLSAFAKTMQSDVQMRFTLDGEAVGTSRLVDGWEVSIDTATLAPGPRRLGVSAVRNGRVLASKTVRVTIAD